MPRRWACGFFVALEIMFFGGMFCAYLTVPVFPASLRLYYDLPDWPDWLHPVSAEMLAAFLLERAGLFV